MAKNIANVDILTDTFNTWLLRTNEIIETVNKDVITANSTQGVTGSLVSPRNALLFGSFTANNFYGNTVSIGTEFIANSSTLLLGKDIKFVANGSTGSAGQILTTNGSKIYWSTAQGTGTVTQIANGAGIFFTDLPSGAFGSPLTSFGTIRIRAGAGIIVDSQGISVNTQFITSSATNAATLQNRTWENPAAIGVSTANTGAFTTVTAGLTTGYRLQGDAAFLISNSVFRTQGLVDATTPNGPGATGGVRVRGNPTSGVAYVQVTDSSGEIEWGHFKAHSNGYIVWSGSLNAASFPNLIPAGTAMLFAQANAPTGWTKVTTHNNKALRVVSGSGGGSGGSTTFTAAFNTQFTTDGTAITIDQMPSHYHGAGITQSTGATGAMAYGSMASPFSTPESFSEDNNNGTIQPITQSIGNDQAHTHTVPGFDVQYVDVIIATKN